ncbi:MAG TPA: glycosyltransferase [Blastocatellia bacterium]|nr:glycosyltransferase [Blastocatellia bacterium]
MQDRNSRPVFYDPTTRRQRYVRHTSVLLAVGFTILAGLFITSVFVNPVLPHLSLRQTSALPLTADAKSPVPQLPVPQLVVTRREARSVQAQTELRRAIRKARAERNHQTKVATSGSTVNTARPQAIGFYVNWDDSSYQSLKRHLQQLDQLAPEWLRLQAGAEPIVPELDAHALELIHRERPDLPIFPMIHNSKDGKWEPQTLAAQIADEAARTRLVNALTKFVGEQHFQGVCIDFEEVPAGSQKRVLAFMQQLHAAFNAHNWKVMQAVPFDDEAWDYSAFAQANDYLMLMAYDEHWAESDAGSIAGQPWFEATLARRMRELDGDKTIVCIGGYGYGWSKGRETEELTFQEAVLAARDSEAKIEFDPTTRNPFFRYEDEDGSKHTVWFLDAATAFNQMRSARQFHPAGFALWRMGSEDPSLWNVFGREQMDAAPISLEKIVYGYDVDFEGMGEILQFEAAPKEGHRSIQMDLSTGLITNSQYLSIPSSYVLRRTGWQTGKVALTFDDGPDATWTPQILDILKREHVPATFFIIGQNGQAHPQLVKRIIAEGHDIGNHSFTHPNLGEIPGKLTELELNATQRLVEALTGHSTRLFRAPYFGDAEPQTADEVEPAAIANRLGYIIVGLRVDPDDWALPGADEIVKRTEAGLSNPNPDERGQIVLLHDGGGNRAQTVAALPRLIRELRAQGFQFATVSELAGLSQAQTMPALPAEQGWMARADKLTFYTFAIGGWLIRWMFLIGIVLGLARMLFIGALAFAQWLKTRRALAQSPSQSASESPTVSIIIAAFNEEKVIAQTLNSLLASEYPNFEIIVVDDGSADGTSPVVRSLFGEESRVRLFTQPNKGKAQALNYGLVHATGDIVVALDADTLFPPHTIGALAAHFTNPRVGAVAGNAKVGNRINLVTRWQALEYITAQNMERRAFALLNGITVVPGAVGAWRRALLDQIGGFASDTLAEDQDLTLKVRKLGYKIEYAEDAIGWTEAPDNLRGLAKQRFRWSFGTLQCMWKHRDALFRPRFGALGFLAMPNTWLFQILFPLISPLMDLLFLWTLVSNGIERLEHPQEYSVTNLQQVLFYYALFLAVDWLAAAFAFALERREQWSLLWSLFLQRFCYRQVMYYVMVKSVWTAARGVIVGWGKLERKATVTKLAASN